MRFILYFSVILNLCCAFESRTNGAMKTVAAISNSTVFEGSFEKVLVRKKRWFVFPKGANAVLTLVITKTILGGSPRGLQESIELESAYSLPPWIEGWKSITSLWLKEHKSAPTTMAPKIKNKISSGETKFDTEFIKNGWNYNHYKSYHGSTDSSQSNYVPSTLRKTSSSYKKTAKTKTHAWHNHREYRERRAIFDKFESFGQYLKVHIRSCIKRAICEVKQELLPEGVSFIQDVARIIFTEPTDHEFEDEYFDDAGDRHTSCARKFSVTCPISPISYFLQRRPSKFV